MGKFSKIIRWVLVFAGFAAVVLFGKKLLGADFFIVMKWSFLLLLLGLIFLPLTNLIFYKFHDGGWLFSKVIGIAVSGWLVWYLSSGFLSFTRENCIIIVILCFFANAFLVVFRMQSARKKGLANPYVWNEAKIFSAVFTELLFFISFLLWCYFRGFKPEAYGTEKFMDYGFMAAVMRAENMPPEDIWLSGHAINYYYLGQYFGSYLTRLSGTVVNYGYNLMLMTVAAFSVSLPYSLIYNLVKNKNAKEQQKASGIFPPLCGFLAGGAVTFTSSLHYPIYKWILPYIYKLREKEYGYDYWFPDATRYIGYQPETNDKTIHEFPNYSFVLGDLHAHVINIMFVLTVLGILYALLLLRKERMDCIRNGTAVADIPFRKELVHPAILMIGFFLGLFNMTNFWDFPIYFVVSGAVILFSNAVICRFSKLTLKLTALQAVLVLITAELTCLPFTLNFDSMFDGIALAPTRTPVHQMAVLWGLPVCSVIAYFIFKWRDLKKEGFITRPLKYKKKDVLFVSQENRIFQLIHGLQVSDLFIITIGFCAIGLILMPEIIYVVDIYSGDYKRANTMFKLTYQAYIIFAVCMAYISFHLVFNSRKVFRTAMGMVLLLLLLSTFAYTKESFTAWYGDVFKTKDYQGLDAEAFMEGESAADYEAVRWINENIKGTPVLLEANGADSYTFFQRISAFTGLPTILGWYTHEWLWRSSATDGVPQVVEERDADVKTIYTTEDVWTAKELIDKYKVSYIYVGGCEREKFAEALNEDVIKSLGTVVFETVHGGETTYIVKIKDTLSD